MVVGSMYFGGKLKVEFPSPVPYVVPITANKFAYVVRETAPPLATMNPDGQVVPANGISVPVGIEAALAAATASATCPFRTNVALVAFAHEVVSSVVGCVSNFVCEIISRPLLVAIVATPAVIDIFNVP